VAITTGGTCAGRGTGPPGYITPENTKEFLGDPWNFLFIFFSRR
jgi:hypothetical protein